MTDFTTTDFLEAMTHASNTTQMWDMLISVGIPEEVLVSHAITLSGRGDWEYGVSPKYGWVTEQGKEKVGK